MRCSISKGHESLRVQLNGEELKKVRELEYLGSTALVDGEMEIEVDHRLREWLRMTGGLGYLKKQRSVCPVIPKFGCWNAM